MHREAALISVLSSGLATTITLSILSLVIAALPAVALFWGRSAKNLIIRGVCSAYIHFFDGIPLLLQLFFVFYCLPLISPQLTLSPYNTAILLLTVNVTAYMAVAMESYSKETGDDYSIVNIVKISVLSLGRGFLKLIKYTTLLSVIAIADLLRTANVITMAKGDITPMVAAIFIYLILSIVVKIVLKILHKEFFKERQSVVM